MLKLGTFERNEKNDRITGVFYCVGANPTLLLFEPVTNSKGKPYYKIYADTLSKVALAEAGTAWPQTAKTGKAAHYYSVRLNSPAFAETLYGKLYPSETIRGQYHLLWEEPDCSFRSKAEIRKTLSNA